MLNLLQRKFLYCSASNKHCQQIVYVMPNLLKFTKTLKEKII